MITAATLPETLRAILEPRGEILEAYLFGSAATGSAQAHSDLDVAVYLREPRPPTSPFGYAADLITALMRGLGVNRVDVVVLNDAPPRSSTTAYSVTVFGSSNAIYAPRQPEKDRRYRAIATSSRRSRRSMRRTAPEPMAVASVDEPGPARHDDRPAAPARVG